MLLIMWRHKPMEGLVQVVRITLRAFCVQEGWRGANMDLTQQFHSRLREMFTTMNKETCAGTLITAQLITAPCREQTEILRVVGWNTHNSIQSSKNEWIRAAMNMNESSQMVNQLQNTESLVIFLQCLKILKTKLYSWMYTTSMVRGVGHAQGAHHQSQTWGSLWQWANTKGLSLICTALFQKDGNKFCKNVLTLSVDDKFFCYSTIFYV